MHFVITGQGIRDFLRVKLICLQKKHFCFIKRPLEHHKSQTTFDMWQCVILQTRFMLWVTNFMIKNVARLINWKTWMGKLLFVVTSTYCYNEITQTVLSLQIHLLKT